MDTADYKDLEIEPESEVERRLRWGRWILAILVLLILVTVPLLWMLRTSLAERALAQWCEARNLVCEGKITRLSTDGGVLQNLIVRSGDNVPLEAQQVSAGLEWDGFDFAVTGIRIAAPILRGTLDEDGLKFYGLEKLGGTGSGGGGALPALTVTDGRIVLQTSAGEITGSAALDGRFPETGELSLEFDPVSLDGPDGTLVWNEGALNVKAHEGRLEGELFVDLEQADIRGVKLSEASVSGLLDTPGDGEGETQLVWNASAASGSWTGYALEGAEMNGRAILTQLPDMSLAGVMGALEKTSIEVAADRISSASLSARVLRLEADLTGREGLVTGPIVLGLNEAELPQGKAASMNVSGQFRREADGRLSVSGATEAATVQLAADIRQNVTSLISLPGLLSAHGADLSAALDRALQGFDAEGGIAVLQTPSGWEIALQGPAQMRAASGFQAAAEVPAGDTWLTWGAGRKSVNGDISLSGGGLPAISMDSVDVVMTGEGLRLNAGETRIAPWRAQGRTFSARLNSLRYDSTGEQAEAGLDGRLGIAGRVPGVDLDTTTLTGALELSGGGQGWRVVSTNGKCLRLDTQGLVFGAVTVRPVRTDVCAENGVFMRPDGDGFAGSARLGNLPLPFEYSSGGGALNLSNARVDWASSKGLALTVLADQLSLPVTIGSKDLRIDGVSPRIGISTRSGAEPAISARLGTTEFGGSLIPANVAAQQFTFDGRSGKGGLAGHLEAEGVSIRDYRDDPLYQPLMADFTAELSGGHLNMTGPLRLAQGGITIANSEVQLDIGTLDGAAHVISRPLTFRPGGLQPPQLSDRLRGLFTDARGELNARADMVIDGGGISGSGEVSVADFGFQTTRLGRVRGVNGTVLFSDLLKLTTAPRQVITVGSLNPGVPLENGRLVFQLDEGNTLAVQAASFPFAGGTLALSPVDWVLGGETQHLDVSAEKIELENLVEVLKLPGTEASGTVSGSFPIDVEGTKILVRQARLKADEEGGRIAYQGPVGDAAGSDQSGAQLAFEALKDFDFTVLELGLDGDVSDRMTVSLLLRGVSRRGIPYGPEGQLVTGQPFEFNINVNSALSDLFQNTQYYTSQKYLTDVIVKQVQDDRTNETESE